LDSIIAFVASVRELSDSFSWRQLFTNCRTGIVVVPRVVRYVLIASRDAAFTEFAPVVGIVCPWSTGGSREFLKFCKLVFIDESGLVVESLYCAKKVSAVMEFAFFRIAEHVVGTELAAAPPTGNGADVSAIVAVTKEAGVVSADRFINECGISGILFLNYCIHLRNT
jgi:hypothetical protein